ncbi:MAG: C-terminal binding protein [Azospirillum sp.]|nr:C-terminal binding protein [Azospirillum sp.]MCZ8125185.1 C-terminal binding protein [Magnetospirillum sp.]
MKVLIPDAQFPGEPAFERDALGDAEFLVHRARDPLQVPDSAWAAADAILLWQDMAIDRAVVRKLARCRIVVRHGVGFDRVDLEACAERNIPVCNVPDYGTEEVANHALACALALRRGLPTYTEMLALDPVAGWRWDTPPLIRRLTGQVFGIVGLGRIGRAAAARAKAFGFDVGFHDPYLPADEPAAAPYRRIDDLGEMLAQADVVSVHCPLTRETHGLLGEANLGCMKKGAILINTARGPIVDTAALLKAIETGSVGGAALDVLPQEPPDPDDPLAAAYRVPPSWLAGRLILTPHAAFYSPESWYDLRYKAAETVRDWLGKGVLRNCVNAHFFPAGALPSGGAGV